MSKNVTVGGAGGAIGGWLVKELVFQGYNVKAVDIKPLEKWFQVHDCQNLDNTNLSIYENCRKAVEGSDQVFGLQCLMGGIGFIENYKAACAYSAVMSANMLKAAVDCSVDRYFYSSSACVYSAEKQKQSELTALKEEDIYPISPEAGYGEEKLFTESLCRYFREDYGIKTRVARYHNVYCPFSEYVGGKEKAPSAVCRKIAEAIISGKHEIEIWGNGEQTRSFMHVDDCVKGTIMIANGHYEDPINLGSSEMVTINQLVDIVEEIAGIKLKRNYNLSAPKGVNGRNSDNSLILKEFGWEPSIKLRDGMAQLYPWVFDQIKK